MPDSPQLSKLRDAVADEQADAALRTADYLALLQKMKAYQGGTGPSPTMEEFMRWRIGVEHQVSGRKLQSGFVDLV